MEFTVTITHISPDESETFAFSVNDEVGLICDGKGSTEIPSDLCTFTSPTKDVIHFEVEKEDIYKELRLLGYFYGKTFKSIAKTDITGIYISLLLTN